MISITFTLPSDYFPRLLGPRQLDIRSCGFIEIAIFSIKLFEGKGRWQQGVNKVEVVIVMRYQLSLPLFIKVGAGQRSGRRCIKKSRFSPPWE